MGELRERYLRIYELLLTERSFEEALLELFQTGEVPGFLHLGIGQEAIAIGTTMDLRRDDMVFMHHRGFGYLIGKGLPPEKIAAEFCGKTTGASGGKGGFHIADPSLGIYGIGGSLGSSFPLSVGAGLTARFANKQQVVVNFFGDGSANREVVGSSLNLASVWKLPILFLCENNGIAISTPIDRSTATARLSDRCAGYNIPCEVVDGNDVLAVNEAVTQAVAKIRAGEGPYFIECVTRRWRPHAEGYPYFGAEVDPEFMAANDCIKNFRALALGEASEEDLASIERKVAERMAEVKRFAIESPRPKPEDALNDYMIRG